MVVFKYPEEPERDFIKRVIGLPGETLELKRKVVYINGKPLTEPYVHFLIPPTPEGQEVASYDVRERYGPVTVPADHYFVMGDNRDNSQDSRYWGFLPRTYVKGKALMVYWSYEGGARGVPGGRVRCGAAQCRVGRHPLLHAHPLGSAAPPDPLAGIVRSGIRYGLPSAWRASRAPCPSRRVSRCTSASAPAANPVSCRLPRLIVAFEAAPFSAACSSSKATPVSLAG